MRALGYERYGASGGDIARSRRGLDGRPGAGRDHRPAPELQRDLAPARPRLTRTPRRRRGWTRGGVVGRRWRYEHIQRTRPRTLAVALNDSPVGAAAWMIEKWSAWAQNRRRSDRPVRRRRAAHARDAALVRRQHGDFGPDVHRVPVPPGHAPAGRLGDGSAGFYVSEAEPTGSRRGASPNVSTRARWSVIPRGGHFLPAEEPELFAQDVREFFRPLRANLDVSAAGRGQ